MAHKVHPRIFRIKGMGDWASRWLDRRNYVALLREDFLIRTFLEERLKDSAVENIEIERFPGKANIIVTSGRPGLIIGRGGAGIEDLRNALVSRLQKENSTTVNKNGIRLEIREVKNPWESAALTAQWVVQQLEKRTPWRRVIKQAMSKVRANKSIKGVRIEVSGRLGGAEIARREHLSEGRLPLQTMRADIDYVPKEAQTTYGTLGVKVWLYKGEKFE